MKAQTILKFALTFLLLAVVIGAFGAHGLKKIITVDLLETFETGVRYQFYHGFALLFCFYLTQQNLLKTKLASFGFILGILLFSFNCYLYVLSGQKIFAMIVPIGGMSFIFGWGMLLKESFNLKS